MSLFRKEAVRVSVVQTVIKQGEKEENWERARTLFAGALEREPQLIVFPEAFVSGVNFVVLRQLAEAVPAGPTSKRLLRLAADHNVHICGGILELGSDGKIYDSVVLIDPSGNLVAKYRRRYLWIGERSYISRGLQTVIAATSLGKIMLVCGYDICFPGACGNALAEEVDLIICSASVFRPLSASAQALAAARAMDHHCYFVYANAVGFHQFANMHYGGGSGVFVDPYFLASQLNDVASEDPERVACAGAEETVIAGDMYIEELGKARHTKLPFRGDAMYTDALAQVDHEYA